MGERRDAQAVECLTPAEFEGENGKGFDMFWYKLCIDRSMDERSSCGTAVILKSFAVILFLVSLEPNNARSALLLHWSY